MTRKLWILALAALPLVACEDEVVSTAPATSAAAPGAAAPSPRGSGAPAGSAAPPVGDAPKFEIVEAEFTESERSRDPFRSFLELFNEEDRGAAKSQREVVLSQFAIDELKLIGIVTRAEPAKAMTHKEALDALGLEPGATAAEIDAAYKSRARQNGSLNGSEKLNRARDVLRGEG